MNLNEVLNTTLKVNEIFFSIQGEGGRAGEASIFIRLAGCNLKCPFCDTFHDPYTEMTIQQILDDIGRYPCEWIVWTGGEPLMQLTKEIINLFWRNSYKQALETNGTLFIPKGFDYVTISPKVKNWWDTNKLNLEFLNIESKVPIEIRFPVKKGDSMPFLPEYKQCSYFISPIFSENEKETRDNINYCISLVKQNNRFKLSVQLQKLLGFQ